MTTDLLFTHREIVIFMQYGTPAHTAVATLSMLALHYRMIWSKSVWPGNSPDLNPIEHLWPILQNYVFVSPRYRNREEFISGVEAWASVSFDTLQRLLQSLPGRISTCLENNGGRSGY